MSLASPSIVAPTRLRLPDLMNTTDRAADDVLSGRYDHLLPAGGVPVDERWFTRLHGDDELDVWLISWVPERSTELHDHGGSLGALTVVSGSPRRNPLGRRRAAAPPARAQATRRRSRWAGCTTSCGRRRADTRSSDPR